MAALSGMGRDDQRATAGRLIRGSSLICDIVSGVMLALHWVDMIWLETS